MMKKSILWVALAIFFPFIAVSQSQVTGIVYDDANGNGKKDRREQGLAGVAVSNGVDVVQTDDKGRYVLPIGEDNIIFVIKPSGYRPPVNEFNQPQGYYIHKPHGSPESTYPGVAPTGPLPKSVDFGLIKTDESDAFTALVFGDPQPYNMDEIDFFTRGIVNELAGVEKVAFGISLGDIVGDDLTLHQPYIEAMSAIGIPWYNLMGNHDMNFDAPADSLSDETFEAHFGPTNFAFNYGEAHFIVLDNILYPDPRDGKGYWGGFRKDQLDFVENNLRFVPKDKLIVLAFHIPLLHHNSNSFRNEDRQRLFDLLKDYPNTLSMSAHTHLQRQNFYSKKDGWHQEKPHHEYNAGTTSGDWYSGEYNHQDVPASMMRDGTPRGYAFLRIKGNEYVIDYQVAGMPSDYQMNLFHPQVVAKGRSASARIYVNFFMGYESSLVEYRIGDGKWTRMSRVNAHDPSFVSMHYRWDQTEELFPGRRPSAAVNSTHLWNGTIPTNLPVGEHRIEVRATDMFGRTFHSSSSYRLELPAQR